MRPWGRGRAASQNLSYDLPGSPADHGSLPGAASSQLPRGTGSPTWSPGGSDSLPRWGSVPCQGQTDTGPPTGTS